MIEVVGEGIEVAGGQIAIPACGRLQPGREAGVEGARLKHAESFGVGRMPGEEGRCRPAGRVGGDVVARGRGRGEDVGESRDLAACAEPADRLDAAELLDVVGAARDRRRQEVPRLETVSGEELRDSLGVPGGGGKRAEREREGVDSLVEEEVAAVGRVRRIDEPEAVPIAEPVGEVGDRAIDREEAGGTERLPIRHQAAEGPPGRHRLRIEGVMIAPGGEGRVEDPRQIVDAVTVPRRSVGDEDEPLAGHDAESGPAGCRLQSPDVDQRPLHRLGGGDATGKSKRPRDEEQEGPPPRDSALARRGHHGSPSCPGVPPTSGRGRAISLQFNPIPQVAARSPQGYRPAPLRLNPLPRSSDR